VAQDADSYNLALAERISVSQSRLDSLLRANQAVVEHLDLAIVLRRIVETAVELVGAQYGALGVLSPDGSLEQLVQVGMTPEEVAAIGHLPRGHGLVGALTDNRRPIRLRHLTDDPRSVGMPAGHPAMDSFLGVPIQVRGAAYGNLYLTNQSSGEFSQEDEELVTALAATAGFAIDNARLFAETQRRQAWAMASAEVTAALLSTGQADPLGILASRTLTLSGADLVCVVRRRRDAERLVIETARGDRETALEGTTYAAAGSVAASVMEGRQPRLIDEADAAELPATPEREAGPTMAIPLVAAGHPQGALVVSRAPGHGRFTAVDVEMAADFAGRVSVAFQLARARDDQQRMLLLEDRGRIARDLHDNVIQQLFATGLDLQSVAGALASESLAERVNQSVDALDAAIAQIRTAIFALSSERSGRRTAVRHRIIDVVNELVRALPRTPQLEFTGPVDLVITGALADDVVAVVREALTNVIKHASAQQVSVAVTVADGVVSVEVIDDGVGIAPSDSPSGLANLRDRALSHGGTFLISAEAGGTRLNWSVPYGEPSQGDEV
jgi:signal transduction histidine kinase